MVNRTVNGGRDMTCGKPGCGVKKTEKKTVAKEAAKTTKKK
jgi:hypothetical protein